MADAEKLHDLLKADGNCKSLLRRHLTQEVFDALKDKTTKFGGTLADSIRSGKMFFPFLVEPPPSLSLPRLDNPTLTCTLPYIDLPVLKSIIKGFVNIY